MSNKSSGTFPRNAIHEGVHESFEIKCTDGAYEMVFNNPLDNSRSVLV